MLEIFQYSFMVRALIAGGIIGITAPVIGTFLVAKRYSLMADTLAHVSLSGVALGLVLGVFPLYTAIVVAVIAALVIERLRTSKGISGDVALSMFLSGGLALAVVLIGLNRGFSIDLMSYLFGSITTVTVIDLKVIGILGVVTLAILNLLYKELVYVSFEEETAKVSGIPTTTINTVLMVLTAITVSLAMRVVGVLLIGALMVIPVVTALQFKFSFQGTIKAAIFFSLLSVMAGLLLSYYIGLASGGTIVLVALALFIITTLLNRSRT